MTQLPSPAVRDLFRPPALRAVQLSGLLGSRLRLMLENRLLNHDDEYLLWPFREHTKLPDGDGHQPHYWGDWSSLYADGRPPEHPEVALVDWHGEFIGTWVAAATAVAANTGNAQLKAKVETLVDEWLGTQQPDGYLGTHEPANRWKSWDIWVQAHALVGLLSHFAVTREKRILAAAVRAANLVVSGFGPNGRSICETGLWSGLTSSAMLEPMVWLYRETTDRRFLDWAVWLVDVDWEQPAGPRLISMLNEGRSIGELPVTKAAELLIVLAGVVELYRETADDRYLRPVIRAWEDISENHLYLTGSASAGELFGSSTLPNDGSQKVGETCVTMCWLYLSASLGRLTGEARFFDSIEQALYNHLLAAQSPDGRGWAYYVGLRDAKRYADQTDPGCCPVRGTRALGLAPLTAFGETDDGVVVNLFERSKCELHLPSAGDVSLVIDTNYPFDSRITTRIQLAEPESFTLRVRVPSWCQAYRVSINGQPHPDFRDHDGYLTLNRTWTNDDVVEVVYEMPVRAVVDEKGNRGSAALVRGPIVYALDQSFLKNGELLDDVVLLIDPSAPAEVEETPAPVGSADVTHQIIVPSGWTKSQGREVWQRSRYHYLDTPSGTARNHVRFVPFFQAGNADPRAFVEGTYRSYTHYGDTAPSSYRVWNPYVLTEEAP